MFAFCSQTDKLTHRDANITAADLLIVAVGIVVVVVAVVVVEVVVAAAAAAVIVAVIGPDVVVISPELDSNRASPTAAESYSRWFY